MKIIVKALIRIIMFLVGASMIFIVVSWVLNTALDEELNPEITEFLKVSPIDPANNAYIAMMGFNAPEGKDPHEHGLEIINKIKGKLESGQTVNNVYISSDEDIKYQGDIKELCGRNGNCSIQYSNFYEIQKEIERNSTLLKRYKGLYQYTDSQALPIIPREAAIEYFYLTLPPLQEVVKVHNLLMYEIYMTVDEEKSVYTDAINALEADVAFLRNMLVKSDNLIQAYIIQSMLRKDYGLLSILLRKPWHPPRFYTQANKMLKPLTKAELSLERAVDLESRYSTQVFLELKNIDPFRIGKAFGAFGLEAGLPVFPVFLGIKLPITVFYQPNATVNWRYDQYRSHYNLLMRRSADDYLVYLNQKDKSKDMDPPSLFDYMFSPINTQGEYMSSWIGVSGPYHPWRSHNLDSHLRLVKLQLKIKEKAWRYEQLPRYLEHTSAELRNPYTGEVASWNAENGTLAFQIMSNDPDTKPLSVKLEVIVGESTYQEGKHYLETFDLCGFKKIEIVEEKQKIQVHLPETGLKVTAVVQDYMGRNFGKIFKIEDHEIGVVEIRQKKSGEFYEYVSYIKTDEQNNVISCSQPENE